MVFRVSVGGQFRGQFVCQVSITIVFQVWVRFLGQFWVTVVGQFWVTFVDQFLGNVFGSLCE